MMATRLARRLGLDRNPLRRRTDKTAACLAAVLITVFLAGAPVLSTVAAGSAGRAAAAARSWRQVPAVVQHATPVPAGLGAVARSWARARWTAPDGRARAGEISVNGALPAGRVVSLWVDAAGLPTGPPPSRRVVLAREDTAAVVAIGALGIVLLCLACAGRWVLDRRRLAEWEAGWAAVGPQWTRRFRSRG
jgi:hypothetical protein